MPGSQYADVPEPGDVLLDANDNVIGGTAESKVTLQAQGGVLATYDTIGEALAAASSGSVITVPPGSWAESFTIPAGVVVKSVGGLSVTTITGALATGTRVTLGGTSAKLEGFVVNLPTDAVPAIVYAGAVQATARNIMLIGKGASGIGVLNSGTGILMLVEPEYGGGACDVIFKNSSTGKLIIVNGAAVGGTANDAFYAAGGGKILCQNYACTAAGFTDIFHCHDAEIELICIECENATTAIHVSHDDAEMLAIAIRIEGNVTNHLTVDPGIDPDKVHFTSGEMDRSKVSYDAAADGVILQYQDDFEGDRGMVVEGELAVGSPARGKETVMGEGDSYVKGMTVITTDATAGAAADGGNLTDVSTAAKSASGSTFSFQGVEADHAIMFGSDNLDAAADALKHWGIKVKQTTAAAEIAAKSFAFELMSDGTNWVAFDVMATHSSAFYRYANEVFVRANSSEHIRFGINSNTTWAKKTISGKNLYWARVRITDNLTTAPVFEQFKLSSSRFEANADGTNTFHGNARFGKTLSSTGNVFGEGGSVGDVAFGVGSGGVPTGWNHNIKNSELNSDGDAIMMQMSLPHGIDTSQPLTVQAVVLGTPGGAAAPTLILSVLPQEVVGVLVADPAFGLTPTARTLGNTETITSKVAQTQTESSTVISSTKIVRVDFGDFDISDYYEGDAVLIRLEMDDDGGDTVDAAVLNLEVGGILWTHGEKQ